MKISKRSAQQIVEEIGKLVKQNINLMDETGRIIASNDHARVGNFHTGAYRVIQNHLSEYYITPELEQELPNVRRGINLPIEVDGEVQGVIGITGEYAEVIKYGQIVKKMAEILIRERMILEGRQLDQRVQSRFLEDWILGTGLNNPQALSERGFTMGIDIRIPRRCVVASARNREQYTGTLEGQMLLEQVEHLVDVPVRAQGGIVLRNAARQILLLHKQETQALVKLCEDIRASVKNQLGVDMIFGVDSQSEDVHGAAAYSDCAVSCFESLRTELLMDDLSRENKLEYLRRVFQNCSQDEIAEYVSLLEVFFACEGSLQKAAEQLYVHKNTMQYRLKRLAEVTGLDVRKPSQAPSLYLAMLLYLDLSRGDGELAF